MCRASVPGSGRRTARGASSSTLRRPTSTRRPASPLTCHGSSWSCTQRIPFPSGARDGSMVSGCPTTTVASAGSSPTFGLVHRTRHTVEARRQVDDGRPSEALVTRPPRRLRQGEVDLHLGAAVAKRRCGSPEQRPVQLRGCGVADHRATGADPSRPTLPRAPPEKTRSTCSTRFSHVPPTRGCTRRARRPASSHRRRGSECRPPAPQRRSPAPCSPTRPHPGRGRCAAPRARSPRAPCATRTSTRASRAQRRAAAPRSRARRHGRAGGRASSRAPHRASTTIRCRARRTRSPRSEERVEHAAPLLAELSRVPVRRAQQERALAVGDAVAVGKSVLTYSSPCRARSSPSCACAGPPTHSGCQALNTSCRKPGSVISAVRMQPPNHSLRSSTQTSQPAFASSAAHARPLTPLPTTTASWSANERPELVVGDEPALLDAELLHRREHLGAALVGNVEPELVRLDPDRVEAALLAEHDRALRTDELGRVRLDRRRIVELRRDRAATRGGRACRR